MSLLLWCILTRCFSYQRWIYKLSYLESAVRYHHFRKHSGFEWVQRPTQKVVRTNCWACGAWNRRITLPGGRFMWRFVVASQLGFDRYLSNDSHAVRCSFVVPNIFFKLENYGYLHFISFNWDFEQGWFWWKSLRVVSWLRDPEPRHVASQIGLDSIRMISSWRVEASMHWQSEGDYLCLINTKLSKTKKKGH